MRKSIVMLALSVAVTVLAGAFSVSAFAEGTENKQSPHFLTAGFAETNADKPINMFLDYSPVSLGSKPMYINDDFIIVPVDEVCGMIGVNCRYDKEWNSVCAWIENEHSGIKHEVLFNIGSAFTTVFGENQYIQMPTIKLGEVVYVPLRTLADAFESEVSFSDEGTHYNVNLSKSVAKAKLEKISDMDLRALERVRGMSSRTDYLIYVSKSEYLVRVYLKGANGWEFIKRFDCAIGAQNTPTVEGQFDYFRWEKAWDYGTYYVGPIMRFYNGYALHSTLIKKDGTPYDNRTGVKISHGCVRLKKPDIEWLSDYIPLYTKVYISSAL